MVRIALVPPCKASLISQKPFLVMRDAVRDLVIIRRVTRLVVREIPSSKPRPRTVATRQFKFLNSYFPDTLTVRGNTGWASFARIWFILLSRLSPHRLHFTGVKAFRGERCVVRVRLRADWPVRDPPAAPCLTRYIESKFSIDARSHTKNLNYRTKIRRMFYDLESGRITCHVTH